MWNIDGRNKEGITLFSQIFVEPLEPPRPQPLTRGQQIRLGLSYILDSMRLRRERTVPQTDPQSQSFPGHTEQHLAHTSGISRDQT
jgi:hypothetical protein